MKKLIAFIALIGISFQLKALEEEIVKSSISNVTVFSQGAQIFRKANYSIGAGITQIIVEGVSRSLDPKSIQVKAFGNIVILDTKFNMYHPKPHEISLEGLPLKVRQDIQRVEDSIELINLDITNLQNEVDVLLASKNIILNNGAVRGQGKVNDSIKLLKETVDYYTQKMNEINVKISQLNRKKALKSKERDVYSARLTKLKNYQSFNNLKPKYTGPIPRIIITVQATAAVSGKLDVSYLVAQAGWIPSYDLRSEPSLGQVNLNYKAQVFQNSGENWENVKLTISTNNPYLNKTVPNLHPWYVNYMNYKKEETRNSINNMQMGVQYADKVQAKAESSVTISSDNFEAATSDQFVTMVNQTISAEYQINLPYTIESNNEHHMVLISNKDLKANYKYYTVPKLDKSAYLVAQISKLEELQLIPAKATIYFDGSYIGETYLDPSSLDDSLNLSLGRDPNIIVKRTFLKNEVKEKIIGNYVEKAYRYLIEVKNQKSTDIDLVIQDQIPIEQEGEIEINLVDVNKGKLNAVTGLIEWKTKLRTKQSQQFEFSFKVKHSKDKPVYL